MWMKQSWIAFVYINLHILQYTNCKHLVYCVVVIQKGSLLSFVVSVELCTGQRYFLLLVNILVLGVHRWWETIDWIWAEYSAEKQGLLKEPSSFLSSGYGWNVASNSVTFILLLLQALRLYSLIKHFTVQD